MKKALLFYFILVIIICLSITSCLSSKNKDVQSEKNDEITVSSDGYVVVNGNKTDYKAHVHEYGEWEVVKSASEAEDGISERVCACGEKETEVIYATGSIGLVYQIDSEKNEATVVSIGNCQDTDVVIPEIIFGVKVTKIARDAFYNNKTLTSVVIGDNVTEIPDEAFRYCAEITSVVIGDGV